MPFCPSCRTEYIEGILKCSDCGAKLVKKLPPDITDETRTIEYKELYIVKNELEADFIAKILEEKDISTIMRDMQSTAYPVNVGTDSEIRLAVPKEHYYKAKEIIQDAIKDETISKEGEFIK